MVSSVPSTVDKASGGEFVPVAGISVTWGERADHVIAFVVSTGLDKGTAGVEGAGGAPGVGYDVEGTESVGNNVVDDRVSSAVVV